MGEEEEKKTTPFDEAMDGIATAIGYLKEHGKIVKEDIDGSYFEKNGELSLETIKEAFIKSATIPDGWDVVKEIDQCVREYNNSTYAHKYKTIAGMTIQALQQAGIEVNDD